MTSLISNPPSNYPSSLSSSSSRHTSVLGFTKRARGKLQESKQIFDEYVVKQRTLIDTQEEQKAQVYKQEKARIDSIRNELKFIQYQRGLYDGSVRVDGNSNVHVHSNVAHGEKDNYGTTNNIVQQKKSLQKKQTEAERELANLHLERKEIQKKFDVTKEKERVMFTKAERVRKSKERIEKAKQVTVEDLTIAVLKYQELGLDFVKKSKVNCASNDNDNDNDDDSARAAVAATPRGDDDQQDQTLTFNFTMIDPQDHDRVFSFDLNIDNETDNYIVQECEPELESVVVMRLLDELNTTVDFASFIRGMRNAFKALADKS